MHREATMADVPEMVQMGIDGLRKHPAPRQVIAVDKLQRMAQECVAGPRNFAWVGCVNDTPMAALCALVHDQTFYERKQASVVQFWTREPGLGEPLINIFLDWARQTRAIKAIVFTLEAGADPRIIDLLNRKGLALQEHPILVEWK